MDETSKVIILDINCKLTSLISLHVKPHMACIVGTLPRKDDHAFAVVQSTS